MRFTSIITFALSIAGIVQALPLAPRSLSFNGVTYTARHSDGSCHSSQEIIQSHILTGIEQCGGGMTVLASVWIDGSDRDNQEISTLKNFLSSSSHQSAISGIIVGNEVLFNGRMSASSLAQKIKSVKSFAKGYKVTTSEIDTTYADEVMDVVDFASVNLHPYFSSNDISMAMDTLKSQFNNFKKKAHGKEVLITETGWPSAGASLGNAVASVENAQAYFVSLGQSGLPYYYFEWQDSNWKSPGQYAVENHFGFLNSKGAMKFAV